MKPMCLDPVIALLRGLLLLSLLLDATPSHGQSIEDLKKGVVKITAQADGKTKVGTGFIVKLDSEIVYIMTAAHVISGDSQPKVQFFSRQEVPVRAQVKHAEGGDNETGMALLTVRGKENVPTGLAALPLATATRVSDGDDIMVVGHPRGAGDWAILKGSIAARQGRYLTVDANIDEGNSGGPIMHSGQVVGLIGGAQRYGKGITIGTVREYLEGHGVVPEERATPSVAKPPPPPPPPSSKFTQPTAKLESQSVTQAREIIGKDGAPMVLVPAGGFVMGSRDDDEMARNDERPAHSVYLDAFYIDTYEVTISRYDGFLNKTGRKPPRDWRYGLGQGHDNEPSLVTWDDARAYCSWVEKRLPTEAEWEKAARGTDQRLYPWGNAEDSGLFGRLANFGHAESGSGFKYDVGSFKKGKSPYGVYDMAGNVAEWVADWYGETYYGRSPLRNPKGPMTGEKHVLRGGSYESELADVRSAARSAKTSEDENSWSRSGFRCAQDVPN